MPCNALLAKNHIRIYFGWFWIIWGRDGWFRLIRAYFDCSLVLLLNKEYFKATLQPCLIWDLFCLFLWLDSRKWRMKRLIFAIKEQFCFHKAWLKFLRLLWCRLPLSLFELYSCYDFGTNTYNAFYILVCNSDYLKKK